MRRINFALLITVLTTGIATHWIVAFFWTRGAIGVRWGFLSGENTIDYPNYGPLTHDVIAWEALIPAVFYLPFALLAAAFLRAGITLWAVLAALWTLAAYAGGETIAGNYARFLGATWAPGEPFAALYWHPALPLVWACGIAIHIWSVRRAA